MKGLKARRLAVEGAKVVLAARRRDKGESVLREIEAAGGEGLFVQTDVTKTADVDALVFVTATAGRCRAI
jgi:NADP-dependent 3-hydroxy acid dehydrogenase YdfG